jgi:hypothetical protein
VTCLDVATAMQFNRYLTEMQDWQRDAWLLCGPDGGTAP